MEARGGRVARGSGPRGRGAALFLAGLVAGAVAVLLGASSSGATAAPLPAPRQPPALPAGGAPPSALCPAGIPDVQAALTSHLDPAFAPWEGVEWGLPEIIGTAEALVPLYNDTVALIRIANNKLEFLDREDDCESHCNMVLADLRDVLRAGLATGQAAPSPHRDLHRQRERPRPVSRG